jgi:hypothetical protein
MLLTIYCKCTIYLLSPIEYKLHNKNENQWARNMDPPPVFNQIRFDQEPLLSKLKKTSERTYPESSIL